jgi:hypothetical protein
MFYSADYSACRKSKDVAISHNKVPNWCGKIFLSVSLTLDVIAFSAHLRLRLDHRDRATDYELDDRSPTMTQSIPAIKNQAICFFTAAGPKA